MAVEEDYPRIAIDLLADDSLNDEQKSRVLALTGDSALAVDSPASIELVLQDTAVPKTRDALIGRLSEVAQAIGTDSGKSKLAEHLIVSLPSLSGEDLHTVTRQIGDLGGQGSLERNDDVLDMLDSEQIDVVAKVFRTSRKLAERAKKSRTAGK
ncbi:MAG: hypothetical protein ACI8W1_002554 [Candidatus Azotimanducaceae bacterium]